MYYYARTGNVNAVQSTKETLPGDPGPAVNLGKWLDSLRRGRTRERWVRPVLDALGMHWPAAEPSPEQDWARLLDEAPVAARALAAAPRRDGAGPAPAPRPRSARSCTASSTAPPTTPTATWPAACGRPCTTTPAPGT